MSFTAIIEVSIELIVRFNVTTESHPFDAPPLIVYVAELLLELYVFPSIQVNESQADCVSVPLAE